MKRILAIVSGAAVAAIVVFVWSWISWEMIGWHQLGYRQFSNPEAMTEALKAYTGEHGIYMLPDWGDEKTPEAMEAWMEKAAAGPFAYAVVRPGANDVSMGPIMIRQFLTILAGALLLAILLALANLRAFALRVVFVALIGLFGGLVCYIPQWNWFEFPLATTVVNVMDAAVTWAFGSIPLALFVRPRPARSNSAP